MLIHGECPCPGTRLLSFFRFAESSLGGTVVVLKIELWLMPGHRICAMWLGFHDFKIRDACHQPSDGLSE